MMNHLIISKYFIVLTCASLWVTDDVAFGEKTTAVSGANNAFKETIEKRDPFWPVGYIPENKLTEEVQETVEVKAPDQGEAAWAVAMKQVEIKGVSSRGNEFFAVINGEVKKVGDKVSVNIGGTVYQWEVERIDPPGSVKLRRSVTP